VKHGDIKPTEVTISAELHEDYWHFTVADNGPGVDPRHHDKIFLPFRKLKAADQSAGSGIGLALVRKSVEDLGGFINIQSNPGVKRGSVFKFSWPAS